jgi:hypothetical protein
MNVLMTEDNTNQRLGLIGADSLRLAQRAHNSTEHNTSYPEVPSLHAITIRVTEITRAAFPGCW